MKATARVHDERGLLGKIVIVWLLLFALFVVAAVDVGSIALTRFKTSNTADKASFEAAAKYKETKDRNQAFQVAVEQVQQDLPGAKIPNNGFSIDTQTGDVTVTVVKKAWTLVAGKLSYTKHYAKVSSTSVGQPPTL